MIRIAAIGSLAIVGAVWLALTLLGWLFGGMG